MKKIVKGAAGQLGKLVLDTVAGAVKEPLGLEKLMGSSSNQKSQSQTSGKGGKVKPNVAQLVKNDQIKTEAEIATLRAQLAQGGGVPAVGPTRNVEKEIEMVRRKKEQLKEQKEKELLFELEQKRKEEEALAQQDAQPASSRPKRGSALARGKGKKGTKETDMRRSV